MTSSKKNSLQNLPSKKEAVSHRRSSPGHSERAEATTAVKHTEPRHNRRRWVVIGKRSTDSRRRVDCVNVCGSPAAIGAPLNIAIKDTVFELYWPTGHAKESRLHLTVWDSAEITHIIG